jgi:hypothetical protein
MGVMIEGRNLFDLGKQALIDLLDIPTRKGASLRVAQGG